MINIEKCTCLFVVLVHRVEPTRQRKGIENDIDDEQSYFGVDQIENRQPSIFVTQILVSSRQMTCRDFYEMKQQMRYVQRSVPLDLTDDRDLRQLRMMGIVVFSCWDMAGEYSCSFS